MLSFKPVILSVVALLSVSLTMPLKADQWNKKTVLTVKETIQLPNTVLQPGTYVFKLADSLSDRHIVQIFTADETQIMAINILHAQAVIDCWDAEAAFCEPHNLRESSTRKRRRY